MRPRAFTLAWLCIATSACSFDLTAVKETVPDVMETPASFYISISAISGEPLDMSAVFEPGTGSDGLPRAIANDTVRINGDAFAPIPFVPEPGFERRNYRMVTPLTPPASLQVQLPRLVGEQEPGSFALNVPGITSTDTIVVSPGQAVEVEVSGLVPGDSAANWSWAMVLNWSNENTQVSVVRNGVLPSVLRFPAELLPPDFARGDIVVNAYSYQDFGVEYGSYPVRVQRQFGARIQLRVIP